MWEKGSEVTKGVGPTPVLHTQSPNGKTVPSWSHSHNRVAGDRDSV